LSPGHVRSPSSGPRSRLFSPVAKCDRCPAHIIFVKVRPAKGGLTRMPVNELPDQGGNVAVGPGGRARIVAPGQPIRDDEVRHMPHFATCPRYKKPAAEPRAPKPRPAPPPDLFSTLDEE
jgi:hypothetical protein